MCSLLFSSLFRLCSLLFSSLFRLCSLLFGSLFLSCFLCFFFGLMLIKNCKFGFHRCRSRSQCRRNSLSETFGFLGGCVRRIFRHRFAILRTCFFSRRHVPICVFFHLFPHRTIYVTLMTRHRRYCAHELTFANIFIIIVIVFSIDSARHIFDHAFSHLLLQLYETLRQFSLSLSKLTKLSCHILTA